jgi:hypothetical protein
MFPQFVYSDTWGVLHHWEHYDMIVNKSNYLVKMVLYENTTSRCKHPARAHIHKATHANPRLDALMHIHRLEEQQ